MCRLPSAREHIGSLCSVPALCSLRSCFCVQLVSLLRCIGGIHPSHRRTLVEQLLLSRHRDHRTITKTPLESVLHFADETHWFFMQTILIAVRTRLDAKGLSLLQAFHLFDLDGNGLLDSSELWTAFTFLGFTGTPASNTAAGVSAEVTPNDVCDVLRLADIGEDGAIDFQEFTHAFRTREEAHTRQENTGDMEADSEQEEQKSDSSSSAAASVPVVEFPKLDLIPIPPVDRPAPPPSYIRPSASSAPRQVSPPSVNMPAPVVFSPLVEVRSPISVATTSWTCSACTFVSGPGRSRCEICDTPKQ